MSGNPLVQLLDADLNSDRNRAILSFLFGRAGLAIARLFPARATACYSGLVIGFALAFLPIAKNAPGTIHTDDDHSRCRSGGRRRARTR